MVNDLLIIITAQILLLDPPNLLMVKLSPAFPSARHL